MNQVNEPRSSAGAVGVLAEINSDLMLNLPRDARGRLDHQAIWRRVFTGIFLALALVFLMLFSESSGYDALITGMPDSTGMVILISLPALFAISIAFVAPGYAMVLFWTSLAFQVSSDADLFAIQLASVPVFYATARYGSFPVVWISGASALISALVLSVYLVDLGGWAWEITGVAFTEEMVVRVFAVSVGFFLSGSLPWVVGMLFRVSDARRRAELERNKAEEEAILAQEVADTQMAHARLARDVHDIVGHSLAVIITQADSVRVAPDLDIEKVREAVENIAVSARQSLVDVREVLDRTGETREIGDQLDLEADLEALIDNVRSAGVEVAVERSGVAMRLDPGRSTIAYRVAQEMLTNAIKHGSSNRPVEVAIEWGERDLALTVVNEYDGTPRHEGSGRGIQGMRDRLATAGGLFRVTDGGNEGTRFEARAEIPYARS